jgi:hypothetical protein
MTMPRGCAAPSALAVAGPDGPEQDLAPGRDEGADAAEDSPWPDLVVIDGGRGQLTAAQETLAALGITDIPLLAVAKGPDRDAGLETFFVPGREPFKLKPRDPVLYFVQRLRDEAHRFAVGSHRVRAAAISEAGLRKSLHRHAQARVAHFDASRRARGGDLPKFPGSARRPRARSTISSTSARDERGQDRSERTEQPCGSQKQDHVIFMYGMSVVCHGHACAPDMTGSGRWGRRAHPV